MAELDGWAKQVAPTARIETTSDRRTTIVLRHIGSPCWQRNDVRLYAGESQRSMRPSLAPPRPCVGVKAKSVPDKTNRDNLLYARSRPKSEPRQGHGERRDHRRNRTGPGGAARGGHRGRSG